MAEEALRPLEHVDDASFFYGGLVFAFWHFAANECIKPASQRRIQHATLAQLTTHAAQRCLFVMAPHQHGAGITDHLAQFANELIVGVHVAQVQPLGMLQRGGIRRSQRVATELKRDLFVGLHIRQVRHGNA